MKKAFIATAIAATFVTPQVFAQTKNFEGFSLTGSLNMASSTTEVTSTIFNGSNTESAQNFSLQGQYTVAASPSFVLGLGLGLNVGELKAGTLTSTVAVKQKTGASFYISPGLVLSEKALVYGKLASISGIFETTASSTLVNGVGVGLGFQTFINSNVFLQVEAMQNQYADRAFTAFSEIDKNKSTVLSLGLGYKF